MPQSNSKLSHSQIRTEIQQIIINGIGNNDLRSIPDDVPILDLGVSSLALVEGMRQVYDRFGVLVSIRRVIEGQITIGTLALYIDQELNSQPSPKKKSQSSPWQAERQIPLAPSQQHLGFLSRYSSEANAAFNEPLLLRLNGTLHGPALHAAIEEVGNRYESLRSALNPEQNTLDVGKGEALELAVSPVSPEHLQARLTEVVARPFEIGKRLFRAELLRLSETEHVLALVGHALVLENHALKIILHDIAQLYQVFSHDQEASAAPLALQWTDYLALNDTAEAKVAQRLAKEYWKDVFASGTPRLELPADFPRPAIKKYSGSRVDLQLDPVTSERLRTFAISQGVQLQTILLAAFSIFIHRISGLDDIVIGVESESLYLDQSVPAVANTRDMLPLRTNYDASKSFKTFIIAQANALAKANLHRNLSLAELIQWLQVSRDQSRSPLFTAAFRSQQEGMNSVFDGLDGNIILPPSSGARYDLELLALNQNSSITLVCDYSTELFEVETISRWLHGIVALLDSGLQGADQACGILPMMPAAERDQIIYRWNNTEKLYPREKTALNLILEQVQTRPEQIAIRFGKASLSYEQLAGRVEALASALHSSGVKHGDLVGILIKRSLDLIPALLAVWRVGAAYVPVDIGFPKQRIAYMLANAQIDTLVSSRELANLVDAAHMPKALWIEDVEKQAATLVEIESARGTDSAYIIYTSGSTGKPKGVEVRHSALLNCLLAIKDDVEFTTESSMLALTTISFDIATVEIFMPLLVGGCVDLAEDGLVANGVELAEQIEDRRPSHTQATPSTWKTVLSAGWRGRDDICLLSAGEAISRELAELLLPKCSALWNFYGPTETTVYSTAYKITSEPGKPMRIGRPLPNTNIYILDKQYQPVPTGAVGDLYISGDGVAVGYLQKPALTAERFVTNPFRAGERMYFTGDLARYLPDGSIVCLGRLDDQVKIHGVRVELAEVEAALRSLAGVNDAVVVSWQDARGDTQLVGHVILDDKHLNVHLLHVQLRERLPEVMVPPYILFAESFPRTANGKIQRAALPSPDFAHQLPVDKVIEAPSTVTEQMLAKAWAKILGIDSKLIGRDSDFMDLGGHSLLMTLLMIEIRKSFQTHFSLREFFCASTLQKFATLIDERRQPNSDQPNIGRNAASARTSEWARQRMAFLQREA